MGSLSRIPELHLRRVGASRLGPATSTSWPSVGRRPRRGSRCEGESRKELFIDLTWGTRRSRGVGWARNCCRDQDEPQHSEDDAKHGDEPRGQGRGTSLEQPFLEQRLRPRCHRSLVGAGKSNGAWPLPIGRRVSGRRRPPRLLAQVIMESLRGHRDFDRIPPVRDGFCVLAADSVERGFLRVPRHSSPGFTRWRTSGRRCSCECRRAPRGTA